MHGQVRVRHGDASGVDVAAEVQCAAALVGYADIFPADAPKPTPTGLVPDWREVLATDPPGTILLAEVAGATVGVAVARVTGPGVGVVSKLYVRPEHWTVGVGTHLLEAAVAVLRDEGCTAAELWVLEHNRRARAWYARHGWRPTGGRTHPWPDLDLVELQYGLALEPARQDPAT